MAIFALAVAAGTAIMLYIYGRQFSRRFVEQHGRLPPLTWLFRGQQDQLLESARRRALALLPILLIAAVIYVLNS